MDGSSDYDYLGSFPLIDDDQTLVNEVTYYFNEQNNHSLMFWITLYSLLRIHLHSMAEPCFEYTLTKQKICNIILNNELCAQVDEVLNKMTEHANKEILGVLADKRLAVVAFNEHLDQLKNDIPRGLKQITEKKLQNIQKFQQEDMDNFEEAKTLKGIQKLQRDAMRKFEEEGRELHEIFHKEIKEIRSVKLEGERRKKLEKDIETLQSNALGELEYDIENVKSGNSPEQEYSGDPSDDVCEHLNLLALATLSHCSDITQTAKKICNEITVNNMGNRFEEIWTKLRKYAVEQVLGPGADFSKGRFSTRNSNAWCVHIINTELNQLQDELVREMQQCNSPNTVIYDQFDFFVVVFRKIRQWIKYYVDGGCQNDDETHTELISPLENLYNEYPGKKLVSFKFLYFMMFTYMFGPVLGMHSAAYLKVHPTLETISFPSRYRHLNHFVCRALAHAVLHLEDINKKTNTGSRKMFENVNIWFCIIFIIWIVHCLSNDHPARCWLCVSLCSAVKGRIRKL